MCSCGCELALALAEAWTKTGTDAEHAPASPGPKAASGPASGLDDWGLVALRGTRDEGSALAFGGPSTPIVPDWLVRFAQSLVPRWRAIR